MALDLEDSDDYDEVRQAVLKAYELVPEAYRQQFRSEKIRSGQTYVDFARQQEVLVTSTEEADVKPLTACCPCHVACVVFFLFMSPFLGPFILC